ncbi:MAG: NlpC/P60 family protein [Mycobacteriales bacterium]
MHPSRRAATSRTRGLLRALATLVACLGLAGTTLAAAGGSALDVGARVAAAAEQHVSESYAWGATGPTAWDCSGLTSTLWREVGGVRDIPRTSRQQQAWAVPIPAAQALPGDLVFFGNPVTHVGIVVSRTTGRDGSVVRMVDASSSQRGVVERTVWKAGVVRYGRVPRPGMPAVLPWTPSTPTRAPSPSVTATATAPAVPTPTPTAPQQAAARPLVPGLADGTAVPAPAVARTAVALARALVGSTRYGDVDLVRSVWQHAGGAVLPSARAALTAAGTRVALRDARIGDLVVYGPPADHVGIYVGQGLMVDGSRALGKVVLRPVWASSSLQLVRLPA